MELNNLGEDVLHDILSTVDAEIVHRFRLVCKKWKNIIDKFEHIQVLLRFPSFVSQRGFLKKKSGKIREELQELWKELETAIEQRKLYLSPLDTNSRMVLDRIFIYQMFEYWEDLDYFRSELTAAKRMELLLDPNSEECFSIEISTRFHNDWTSTRSIFIEPNNALSPKRSVDLQVGNYLLKKLGLDELMTPEQFLISLSIIGFGKPCEEFLQPSPLADVRGLKIQKIQRTSFEVFFYQFC